VVPVDAPAAVAVAGPPWRRYLGEVACAGCRPDAQGALVDLHWGGRLSLRGRRLHGRLYGGGTGTLPARVPGLFRGRCTGPVRGTVWRRQGPTLLLLGPRPPQVRGRGGRGRRPCQRGLGVDPP